MDAFSISYISIAVAIFFLAWYLVGKTEICQELGEDFFDYCLTLMLKGTFSITIAAFWPVSFVIAFLFGLAYLGYSTKGRRNKSGYKKDSMC